MHLHILRHAIAVPRGTLGYPNDDRPLTEEGISKMVKCAKGIAMISGKFDVIISSPLIRALETAKITAEAAGYTNDIVITEYLIPGTPQKKLIEFISKYHEKEKVLIVGHEPQLGFFASKLIGSDYSVIELKKGGICRIDIEEFPMRKSGKLIWHLTPAQLRSIAKHESQVSANE